MMKRLLAATLLMMGSIVSAADLPMAQTIQAAGPKAPLNGTLQTVVGTASATVLIMPGSGPTDRNGNNPLGIKAASYQLLAEALAKAGIASVRIDKRGLAGSGGAVDGNAVTMADYVTDTRNWISVIRAKTGARCIWLLGHSEGGLVALLTAQNPADICGVVLLAAPGRPFGILLKEQLSANPANAPLLGDASRTIDRLTSGKRVDVTGLHPALQQLFAPQIQGFMIDIFKYDPARLLATAKLPALIVQGQQDLQVREQDAKAFKTARPDVQLVLLPDVNHVLKVVPVNDSAANAAAYANPDLPIAGSLVVAITQFLKGNSGKLGKRLR